MTISTQSLALPSLLLLSGCSLVFAPSNYSSGADLGAIDGGSTDQGPADAPPSGLDLGLDDGGAPPDLGSDGGAPPLWPQCNGSADMPRPLSDVYGARVAVPPDLQMQWTGTNDAMFGLLPNDFDLNGFTDGQTLTSVSIAADTDPADATADNLYVALGGSGGGIRLLRLSVDALGAGAMAEEFDIDLGSANPVRDVSIAVQGSTFSLAALAGGDLILCSSGDFGSLAGALTNERVDPGARVVAHAGLSPIYLDGSGVRGGTMPVTFGASEQFDPPVLIGSQSPIAFSRVLDGRWLAMSTRTGARVEDMPGSRPGWLMGSSLVTPGFGSVTREHALRQRVADQFEINFQGTVTCETGMPSCPFEAASAATLVMPSGYLVAVAEGGVHQRMGEPVTDFIVAGTRADETSRDGTEVRVFPFVTNGGVRQYSHPEGITIGSGTMRATGGSAGTLTSLESAVTSNTQGVGVFAVALVNIGAEPAPRAFLSGFRACAP